MSSQSWFGLRTPIPVIDVRTFQFYSSNSIRSWYSLLWMHSEHNDGFDVVKPIHRVNVKGQTHIHPTLPDSHSWWQLNCFHLVHKLLARLQISVRHAEITLTCGNPKLSFYSQFDEVCLGCGNDYFSIVLHDSKNQDLSPFWGFIMLGFWWWRICRWRVNHIRIYHQSWQGCT